MLFGTRAWSTLEQWSPAAFLTAGGLFVFPAVAYIFNTLTGTEIIVSPAFIFMSLCVVFVGILGLYPRLAERDSTMGLGGVGLLALTAATIISALGLPLLPFGVTYGKETMVAIIVTVTAGSILTFTTFGVASLRTGAHPRLVGGCLLAMAAGETGIVAATLMYSNPNPTWVEFVVSLLFVTSLGAIGYVLQTRASPAEHADSTGDMTTS